MNENGFNKLNNDHTAQARDKKKFNQPFNQQKEIVSLTSVYIKYKV